VRAAPHPLPPPPTAARGSALSIAIVTLVTHWPRTSASVTRPHGGDGESKADSTDCALVLWCERAALLVRALTLGLGWRAKTLLMGASADALATCDHEAKPSAVLLDARVTSAMDAARTDAGCACARDVNMLKLSALALTDYDLVLYADYDINLMPTNDLRPAVDRWATMAPTLLASRFRFVANADAMSPVNGGLWLVKPSVQALESMLRLVAACAVNGSHGWSYVGPPSSLALTPRHVDGESLRSDVGDVPSRSDAYRRDDWRYVAGVTDQGFLWYWFFIRRDEGAYFRYAPNKGHLVLHWRAWPKPWVVGMRAGYRAAGAHTLSALSPWELSYAYSYLRDLTMAGGGRADAPVCLRELWSFRRAIEDDDRFDDLPPTLLGSSVPFFALW
jgi:hypothetical protein